MESRSTEASALLSTEGYYGLEPNKVYVFSFWTKQEGESGYEGSRQFSMHIINETNGSVGWYGRGFDNNTEWEQYFRPISTYNKETKYGLYVSYENQTNAEVWVDDIRLVDANSLLSNVIRTDSTELAVWNSDKTMRYAEGVDYYLTTSGTADYFNIEDGNKTIIHRIETGSIDEFENILVDYDYVITFSPTRYGYVNLLDPEVYTEYEEKLLIPVLENLDPDYIGLIYDEMWDINRDSRSQAFGLENYQAIAYSINRVSDIIWSHDPDVGIMTWDDMISPFHNGWKEDYHVRYGGKAGADWYALDLIDRKIIPVAWWYSAKDLYHAISDSGVLFEEMGFENYMGAPNNVDQNIRWWSSVLGSSDIGLGVVETDWYGLEGIEPVANHSWNVVEYSTDECDADALELCDGIDNDCDNLYLPGTYTYTVWPDGNIDEGFNLSSDIFNCGSCGNICYYPRGFSSCVDGECYFDGCYEFYEDRNGNLNDGCEYPDVVTYDDPTSGSSTSSSSS